MHFLPLNAFLQMSFVFCTYFLHTDLPPSCRVCLAATRASSRVSRILRPRGTLSDIPVTLYVLFRVCVCVRRCRGGMR